MRSKKRNGQRIGERKNGRNAGKRGGGEEIRGGKKGLK